MRDRAIDDLAEWYNGPNRLDRLRVAEGHRSQIAISDSAGEDVGPAQKTAAALQGGNICPGSGTSIRYAVPAEAVAKLRRVNRCMVRARKEFPPASPTVRPLLMLGTRAHAMVIDARARRPTQALEDGSSSPALRPHAARGVRVRYFACMIGAIRGDPGERRIEFAPVNVLGSQQSSWTGSDR